MRAFPIPRDRPLHPPTGIDDLRRHCPVARVRLWNGEPAWLLTRHEDVRSAFADERLSADAARPGYPHVTAASAVGRGMLPNFMVMDDPEHRRLRELFLPDFMPGPLAARRADLQAIVDARIDALLRSPQPADLLAVFARPIPALALAAIMGLEITQAGALLDHVLVILRQESSREQAAAANRGLIEFLDAWIEAKLAAPGPDMISRLASQLRAGALSRQDVLGCLRQLFLAGQDSTASTLTLGALLLLEHPDQLAALTARDEPALWAGAVEEIVRFTSVTHFGRRRVARADLEIAGQPILAGEGLILAETFANRDGAVFPDPDGFDVFRSNSRVHLGFGHGGHHCLGAHLARMELTLGLSTLFRRVPGLRLACSFEDLVFQDGLTIYGVESLPVAWPAG